jgi:hypothetical protein
MVPVPVPSFEKVIVPVPVPTFEKLRFRFRIQFHIYTIKSKFFFENVFPFYIVINYGSGSGSDLLTSYGSGSGSTRQKVMVPTVPVYNTGR